MIVIYCTSLVHHAPREPGSFFSRRIRSFDMISVQSNVSIRLRRKKEKEMYFKNLKKKRKHLFGALHKLHLRTFTLHPFFPFSFLSLANSRQSVLFLKITTSGNRRYLLVTTSRYFIRSTSVQHSLISSHPISLSLSFSFLLSFYQIYLPIYFSVVHSSASIRSNAFMVLRLYTSFLTGPWRKRAGSWPD